MPPSPLTAQKAVARASSRCSRRSPPPSSNPKWSDARSQTWWNRARMDRTRDRMLAVGAVVLVLALALLIVFTVLEAQNNGRQALERLQLSQVRQLGGELDSAVKQAFAGGTAVNASPAWNLAPNDPSDARRLQLLQPPNSRTGSILVDRNGTI